MRKVKTGIQRVISSAAMALLLLVAFAMGLGGVALAATPGPYTLPIGRVVDIPKCSI